MLQSEKLFRQHLAAINEKYQVFSEIRGQGMLLGAVLNDKFKGRSREFFLASADQGLMALVQAPVGLDVGHEQLLDGDQVQLVVADRQAVGAGAVGDRDRRAVGAAGPAHGVGPG